MTDGQFELARRSYAAPLSYVGSTRRLAGWARTRSARWAGSTGKNTSTAVVAWTLAVFAMVWAWIFVTAWYLVVLGIFGLFTVPFRLMRRSQRRREHLAEAQLAAMQSIARH